MLKLKELKQFLRIDHNDEDAFLGVLMLLSAEICLNFLRLDKKLPNNESVKQAQMLICGYFYENRQGTKDDIPPAVYHLLAPYRKAAF